LQKFYEILSSFKREFFTAYLYPFNCFLTKLKHYFAYHTRDITSSVDTFYIYAVSFFYVSLTNACDTRGILDVLDYYEMSYNGCSTVATVQCNKISPCERSLPLSGAY